VTSRIDAGARDPWLVPWLPLIAERVRELPILELGCGGGRDTEVLVAAGHRVVGLDLSGAALERARQRAPAAQFHCGDIRSAWPLEQAGVIVASLSLHYFAWDETIGLVERIRRVLVPGGVLLCRLNSTEDHHFGASGRPAIGENYYLVDGEPKRFFDRAAVDCLFAQVWRVLAREERVIDRYDHPKSVWEIVMERSL
jgi:SAM-dependent methyltransferase